MEKNRIQWAFLLKDVYNNTSFRRWSFISVLTYVLLIQMGTGPLFSFFILIPSSVLTYLVFFLILEEILLPLYSWLTGGKRKS
jgi:hypothetical protein